MRIHAISISSTKGTRKQNVPAAELRKDFGIIGDAHAGPGLRQVSLLSLESIQASGFKVNPGDFAENITTQGLDLSRVALGDRIAFGKEVVLEISQIGKTCHSRCEVAKQIGDCIMPRQGIFARVIQPGTIRIDDKIELIKADRCCENIS